MQGEANFILPEGIPGRPWFKHLLYSARYTYAHLELPAITEAIESGNWAEAQRQTEILIRAINAETSLMKQVTETPETQLIAVFIERRSAVLLPSLVISRSAYWSSRRSDYPQAPSPCRKLAVEYSVHGATDSRRERSRTTGRTL